MRLLTMDRQLAEQHYAEHQGKSFYDELVSFITSGPLVALVLEGQDAVTAARQVIGATNPLEATTGSIRGDFAIEVGQNMVHGSDSPESAAREVALFSPALCRWRPPPRSGGRSSRWWGSRSRSGRPASRSWRGAIRAPWPPRTPAARPSPPPVRW